LRRSLVFLSAYIIVEFRVRPGWCQSGSKLIHVVQEYFYGGGEGDKAEIEVLQKIIQLVHIDLFQIALMNNYHQFLGDRLFTGSENK